MPLADVVALAHREIQAGPIWLRVRLLDTPAALGAVDALRAVAGTIAAAQAPEGQARPPQAVTADIVQRAQDACLPVAVRSVVAIGTAGPDGAVAWDSCTVVTTGADDAATGHVLASTLDAIAPGCLLLVAAVAMHAVEVEGGKLRPFSAITPPS